MSQHSTDGRPLTIDGNLLYCPYMDTIETRLAALEEKIDHVRTTTDRLYKIFLLAVIITVVGFVLPLIGMAFVLPKVIASYSAMLAI